MSDNDFVFTDCGSKAAITTNNWTTTQWLRDNVPDIQGTVTGGNYATVNGASEYIRDVAVMLIEAGFTCEEHGAHTERENHLDMA